MPTSAPAVLSATLGRPPPLWESIGITVVRRQEVVDERGRISILAHHHDVRRASWNQAVHDPTHLVHGDVQHHGGDVTIALPYGQHGTRVFMGRSFVGGKGV